LHELKLHEWKIQIIKLESNQMTNLNEIKAKLQNEIYFTLHSNMLHDIYFTSPSMLRTSKLYSNFSKLQSTTKLSKAFQNHQGKNYKLQATKAKTKKLKSYQLTNEGERSPIYIKDEKSSY